MSVIGQAIIEVVGSAKGFPATVQEGVRPGLVAAEEETALAGEKMGSNLKGKFGSAFGGIGQIAKLAIGVGVAEAFKVGFEKVEADQKLVALLNAGIKSTGDAAHVTVPGMEDLADSIQHYSGQSKESILAADQLLLRFTNLRDEAGKGNDVFTQTTKIAADMAARLGGDAASQATRLGRALDDPIKGTATLTRIGVTFTAAQKEQIKALVASGNTMGAQKIILSKLSDEYGGSAKAVGETLPGKIQIAKLSFEDMAGTIVNALLPVFNILIGVITTLAPVLEALAPVLAPIAIGVLAIVGAVKAWTAVQAALDAVLEANPIVLIVTALAVLVVGLIAAYQHSATFREIVQAAFHAVGEAIGVLLGILKDLEHVFTAVIGAIVGFVKDHWMLILGILTGPIGLAVAFIISHWNDVSSAIRKVVDDVIRFFTNLVTFVTSLPGKIASAASGMWDGIKEAFRDAINWIIRGWDSLHFKIPGFSVGPLHFGGFTLGLPQIPQLATGGTFNGLAIAGEFGPELVAGSGRVFNRNDTQKMLGSSVIIHPGAFTVTIQGSADKDTVEAALEKWSTGLVQSLRRRGVVTA